ncbi:flagellar radial spoke protein-like, putative [Trypanosoma equiperdum]|uniref:Flagellar radial spoke protein-like, putative n=4 Tax=Trypanozoon TaxID=39700 RepID=Q57WA5_TRYB2|nr:flagellar radial spoke protein-like, putative [Trypanosoma brucei gambiense DAL972]XP_843961.1 flagellar radial spoke protein-like, putative [Trypanosoma brucei brucei TREU927]AAX70078.1 flagellar radial spoke protein-like, putative [Trypanosoma brucei]RHW73535.1 flagellar radial spoke protein-like [Trypanosoma brucei equiperdum]SCU66069.1 flagellar radial spoke protein-like, putative [Trypanosoma equiperdum]AAZ10402.1 flagellar radial spoke protein-like, putative [Trypanosoma brucei brucei|eukprot:XP_011772348.1 flagellar radial spoke protein-like, putative [Trypanosoma brucei gambiense DAL972]
MASLTDDDIRVSPLWEHMKKVLLQVVQQQPSCALEAVVPASLTVQTGTSVPPRVTTEFGDHRPKVVNTVPPDALENLRWASSFGTALVPPKPRRKPQEDEEDMIPEDIEEEEEEVLGEVGDVVAEQAIFNSVGEGLPPEEAFRLVVGMKQLMRTEPLANVRFWGKFYGSVGDYYIVETKIDPNRIPEEGDEDGFDEVDEEEDGEPVENIADVLFAHGPKAHADTGVESSGTGLNEFVYYAANTTDPTRWARLPDVTPTQIIAARLIRRGFTGDLEATVDTHPRFPGCEKHYVRAQIARINCTCRVAPIDMYTTEGAVPVEEDEDGNLLPPPATVPAYSVLPPLIPQEVPDEEDAEAIEPVKSWFYGYRDDELLQGKYWVHIAPTLLLNGRTVASEQETAGDDDGRGGEVDHSEKIHPFLCEVSRDEPLRYTCHSRSQLPAWSFRKAFHDESSKKRTYVARSCLWPGAYTYVVTELGKPGSSFQSVYIGSGLKSLQGVNYAPKLPPRCLVEYPEVDLLLQRDGTLDDELEYAPPPPKPEDAGEDEEEYD